jgi:uncharacterized protein YlxP (DUF503 family)
MTAVGLLSVDLHIPESRSLKAKRKVVQSIITKLRQRFNVAVAEVEFQDKWQRCKLGVITVSNEGSHVDEQLRTVLGSIEDMAIGRAVILDFEIEIL